MAPTATTMATATELQNARIESLPAQVPRMMGRAGSGIKASRGSSRQPGRLCRVGGRVDVEERIDRLGRPFGQRNPVACRPYLDLAQVFVNHGATQVLAQRDRP